MVFVVPVGAVGKCEESPVRRPGGPPAGAAHDSRGVRCLSPAAGHGGELFVYMLNE